jgi:hypothetical protein
MYALKMPDYNYTSYRSEKMMFLSNLSRTKNVNFARSFNRLAKKVMNSQLLFIMISVLNIANQLCLKQQQNKKNTNKKK